MRFREESDKSTETDSPGYWRWHAWKIREAATREALLTVRAPTGSL